MMNGQQKKQAKENKKKRKKPSEKARAGKIMGREQ